MMKSGSTHINCMNLYTFDVELNIYSHLTVVVEMQAKVMVYDPSVEKPTQLLKNV